MTRKQRILAFVGAGLATGLLLAGILLYTASRTEYGMERVRQLAVSWLTNRVDGTVHIGSLGGHGLFGGVTLRDFYIIDRKGRPFMRADSITLAYNWRTFLRGEVVVDGSAVFNPQIYFEQLPGDTIWNFQHVFPDRSKPGELQTRRLILLHDMRISNATAIVRIPFDTAPKLSPEEAQREVVEQVPGGVARVMRFDSLNGVLSRVLWESPTEDGRLVDIRSMTGRSFWWREPMHVAGARGTVTLRDSVVTFDMPDARLPSSSASIVGRVVMERGSNFFDVRVDSRKFAFRDLQWLYPRLPNDGGGSGTLRIQSQRPKGVLWLATNTRIAAPGTRLAGDFGVVTGADSLYFTNVDLRASPLNLALLQSIVPRKLPLQGLLVGTVEIKGGLSALDTRGDLRLSNAAGTSGVKWRGTLDVKHGLGSENFRADVDKFDLGLLNAVRPNLKLRGQLTGHVEASGNVNSTLKFAGDLHHYLAGFTSSFNGAGTYTGGSAPGLDIQMNALPLSLEQIGAAYPALNYLRGDARGAIRLFGPLSDLQMQADVQTAGGRAQIDARLSGAGASPRYAGAATLYSFQLNNLIDVLPETTVDGKVNFDVAGSGLADATGHLGANLGTGRIQNVDFRNAHVAMTLERGAARLDTLVARTMLGELDATGDFGLTESRSGTIGFTLRTDSIAPFDSEAPAETAGRVRGAGSITGSLASFDLRANVDISKLRYAAASSSRLALQIGGTAIGTNAARFTLRTRADTAVAFGVKADSSVAEITYGNRHGTARWWSGSADSTNYVIDTGFEPRDHGILFTIDQVLLGKRATPWALARAASVSINDRGLSADSMEIARAGGGRVRMGGHIAWGEPQNEAQRANRSDFRLDFAGVPFTEFALITAGASDVHGTFDGHLRVTGNALAPVLDADASVSGFGFRDAAVDQLNGSFTYADRRVNVRVDAEKAERRVFFADGVVPVNLAFVPVENRKLSDPLRFSIQADSLPATFLTSLVPGFSDVRGRLDGSLAATGTTTNPTLSGLVTLQDGDASWDVTNVRYHDVDGTARIEGGRTARLDATLKSNGGSGHVTGTIDLKQLGDPGFNLLLNAQNFEASRRRDVEFTASGNVQLLGRYQQPVVTGSISVDQGTMFLDELYRRYQIIELDNPLLYDVVDTALVSLRTIMPEAQSPFVKNLVVQNLRVNVGREAWLRSRDLNVEVSGDLTVSFLLPDTLLTGPRTAQDLIMNGSLRAVRGTYQFAGPGISRQFTIRDGNIEFPGTPGLDPSLAFNAVYRARSPQRDPIDIVAVVGGTLQRPSIKLTSDQEPPISESDLASYLFFGVPTYELSATQSAAVRSVTSGALANSVTSSGFGYLASGLQSFAQNFGLLDYVSLSAAESGGPGLSTERGIGLLLGRTQLEVGRYLGQNIYVAVSQRLGSTSYQYPGVRVEWTFVPGLTGQFFVEDRFARSPDFGIQNTTGVLRKVFGFFVYREWGY